MFWISLGVFICLLGWIIVKGNPRILVATSALGLLLGVILGVAGMQALWWGRIGFDVTADSRHEMAQGSAKMISSVEVPITIRLYRSGVGEGISREWKEHCQNVESLLREIVEKNEQFIHLEVVDPEPGSDGEESALLDGMRSRNAGDKEWWCGVVVSGLDRKRVISLIDPSSFGWMEGEFVRAIREVSREKDPFVGVMSAFDLKGPENLLMGMSSDLKEGWLMYQQLSKSYELIDISLTVTEIPQDVETLLIIHPAGISDETQRGIEQFLERGGKLIVCLDGFSVETAALRENSPIGQQSKQPKVFSSLPKLFNAWGIDFSQGVVVSDPEYASLVGDGEKNAALLSLNRRAMKQEAENAQIGDLYALFAGGFNLSKKKVNITPLIVSGEDAFWQIWHNAQNATARKSSDASAAQAPLAIRIDGDIPKAFSSGFIGNGQKQPRVWLIGDSDMFANDYAFDVQRVGELPVSAKMNNGNLPWLMNILDVSMGSEFVLGGQNRHNQTRPLEKLENLERIQREESRKDVEKLQKQLLTATRELASIQAQRTRLGQDQLKANERAQELANEIRQTNRNIRERNKEFRRKRDEMKSWIMGLNLAVVPSLVVLLGVIVSIRRQKKCRKVL